MAGSYAQSMNRRIKDHVLSRIHSGEWPEGCRIPSEAQLCETFGTSRMTVNRALRELTEMGYLTRAQGSGTYVAGVPMHMTMLEIRSIRREVEARGGTHRSRVLRLGLAENTEAGGRPCFPEGVAVAGLECVHLDGTTPIQYERRRVNLGLAPGFLDQDFTLTTAADYLLETVSYSRLNHMVSAVGASETIAGHLGIREGAPCLQLTRETWLGDELVTQVDLIHPGHEFRLTGTLPVPARVQASRR